VDDLLEVAREVQAFAEANGWRFAFIGGLANLAWGEVRTTRDADLTLFTSFEGEEGFIDLLLERYESRIEAAKSFALRNRVLLLKSGNGIGIDIGLAGFNSELEAIERSVDVDFGDGLLLRVITAEDLIVMKAFAGRDQDWADIAGVIRRQGDNLNWSVIDPQVEDLSMVAENAGMISRLNQVKQDNSDG
jgi:hypothetical protein